MLMHLKDYVEYNKTGVLDTLHHMIINGCFELFFHGMVLA